MCRYLPKRPTLHAAPLSFCGIDISKDVPCCGREPGGSSRRCHAQAAQQTPPDATGGRYPPPRQAPGRDGCRQCGSRSYELLTSMPGVGPVLAFTLIALLPELGKMSRKHIAALVGLAPYDFDSGKLKGHRSIYGGRMSVRNVLYMAALSASRYSAALKAFHNRLADADKKSKVIIVAVMRKMITTLNAMLRDNAVWQPQSA